MLEADVKRAVNEYLQYQENLGNLLHMRLNAGSFILTDTAGNFRRRVQGVKKGTADYVVFQGVGYYLAHYGQSFEFCQPVPGCRVTFIECKSTKGKTTKEQDEFAEEVKRHHCRYFVIRDADEIVEVLK